MTYCKKCSGYIPDIGEHFCPPQYPVITTPLPAIKLGQKCDVCGSTAIDHTENQCSLNRQLHPKKEKEISECCGLCIDAEECCACDEECFLTRN